METGGGLRLSFHGKLLKNLLMSRINVTSHHEVASWLNSQVKEGTLKPCVHLRIIRDCDSDLNETFLPDCDRRSFEWKRARRDGAIGPFVMIERQLLTYELHTCPIRCPSNCTNYIDRRLVQAETLRQFAASRWASRMRSVGSFMSLPFQWF